MRVFVTGATGFIGRHLCDRLLAGGDQVVALVRARPRPSRTMTAMPAGVEVFPGDLSVFADPTTVLPPCDVVIHLAGVVAAKRMAEYRAINYGAVTDLIACLRRQRWTPRRFLFASSLAAAGPSPPHRPWTEDDPPCPIDAYGVAKASAEEVVRAAPFPTTSFRPPIVLGPGDAASLTLFRAARTGIGVRVAGPLQRLSFVDVRDLVDAIVCMAADRRAGSFTYYTSHPLGMDIAELWRGLGSAVGKRVVVVPLPRWLLTLAMCVSTAGAWILRRRNQLDLKQLQQMTAPAFVCSSDKLSRDLGWTPRYDLTECLANAADGYRAAALLRAKPETVEAIDQ
jgi:dihydroflavonol-4-reductase